MLSVIRADRRITLKDRILRTHGKADSTKKELTSFDEFEHTIQTVFQLKIHDQQLRAAWEKLKQVQ